MTTILNVVVVLFLQPLPPPKSRLTSRGWTSWTPAPWWNLSREAFNSYHHCVDNVTCLMTTFTLFSCSVTCKLSTKTDQKLRNDRRKVLCFSNQIAATKSQEEKTLLFLDYVHGVNQNKCRFLLTQCHLSLVLPLMVRNGRTAFLGSGVSKL